MIEFLTMLFMGGLAATLFGSMIILGLFCLAIFMIVIFGPFWVFLKAIGACL